MKLRPLKGRVFGTVCTPEVSDILVMPEGWASSTVRVEESDDPLYEHGMKVIVDRGQLVLVWSSREEEGAKVVFYGSAVLAVVPGASWGAEAAPLAEHPYVACHELDREYKVWRPRSNKFSEGVLVFVEDWKKKAFIRNDAGFVVRYKGWERRLVSEEDVLAVVEE